MGVEEIEQRIADDAQREIEGIRAQSEKEVEDARRENEQAADVEHDKVLKSGRSEIELIKRRIIADASIKARQMVEQEKSDLVDSVFSYTRERIMEMDDSKKAQILKRLSTVSADAKDMDIMVDKSCAKLIKGAVTSDIGDFGVVLVSKDGKTRIDNTLSNRLGHLEIVMRPDVVKALFGE